MKQLYALLFCLLLSFQLPAQELAKKATFKNGVSEKFLVLKKDKSVKHGQYLRIHNIPVVGEYMMELGQYDHNQKTGTWITFYHETGTNSIESVGDYKKDQKEGSWSYYHELYDHQVSLRPIQGSIKRTRIVPPENGSLEYTVEVNGENHILESTGHYASGTKVGIWEYYDQTGNLTQSYNHTTNELLEDRTLKPENAFMTYVGGMNRFRLKYYAAQRNFTSLHQRITEDSEAVFELQKDGNFRFVSASGNSYLKEHAEKILKTLPNEWIYAEENSADKGRLQVSLKVLKPEDRNRLSFHVDFNVVE